MFDIIIKNGRVMDPTQKLDQITDIGIIGEKIARMGFIDPSEGVKVINASGCYVTPGLIDYHAHVFYRNSDFCMPAEVGSFSSGVTYIVDGGSAGSANYEGFYRDIITRSMMPIKTFLHVSSSGQPTAFYPENTDPKKFNHKQIAAICEKYKDNIIGLKLRQQRNMVGEYGLEPLKEAVAIGNEVGLPLSVHVSDSPGEIKETLDILRPGDIFCHMYHKRGKHILDDNGRILPEILEARKKGILFDAAHGSMQFSTEVAGKAIAQGFLPDIITSDLSLMSMYRAPVYSLAFIMTEFLNLGMTFEQILQGVLVNPAKLLGIGADGFLKAGNTADIAIFKIEDKNFIITDCYGSILNGNKMLNPQMTIKDGVAVYRQYDFF